MGIAKDILFQINLLEVNSILDAIPEKVFIGDTEISKAISQFKKQQKKGGKVKLAKNVIIDLLQDIKKVVGGKLSSKLIHRIVDIINKLGGGTELVL